MDVRDYPVDELVLDPNLNLRDRLDDATIARYAESWGRLPPVTVFLVDGRALLADGFHRHAAAVTLGKRSLPAEVREGTFAEALDFAAGANLFHGLPLSRAERRRAVEVRLRIHHERSDRHLAEELGVGRETIAKVRRQLVEAGQIPTGQSRLGADGKLYPVGLPRDPNERLPTAADLGRDDPRDRGGTERDPAPWDDATTPMPPVRQPPGFDGAVPPWEDRGDPKSFANGPPVEVSAPTIDEMLAMMTRQVMEIITWSRAGGFDEAYRAAGQIARDGFQGAVIQLSARAEGLRKP